MQLGRFPIMSLLHDGTLSLDDSLAIQSFGNQFETNGGVLSIENQYFGQVDHEGKPNGIGRMKINKGLYEGSFRDGKQSGYGRGIMFDGRYYEGWWREGVFHGQGKMVDILEKKTKEGQWENGQLVTQD